MARNRKRSKSMSAGCLMVFALPFAAVGVGMTVYLAFQLATWAATQRWVEVPAKILEANLERHRDHEGGTSYKATARYEYEFGGRQYESKRVSISHGSDNIGNFQRRVAGELEAYEKSGKAFRCFVNPEDPSDAVLYRQLRVEMIVFLLLFATIFGSVGFGMVMGSWLTLRSKKTIENAREINPDEPWKWRSDWASGQILQEGKAHVIVPVLAAYWNIVTMPVLVACWREALQSNAWIQLAYFAYPVVGVFLLWLAWYYTAKRWKFGASTFEMATVPGVVGGPLAGVVQVSRKLVPQDGFVVSLQCIRNYQSGEDTHTDTLWEDECRLARELLDTSTSDTAIPVQFAIPYNARETKECSSGEAITWHLEVKADDPGIDYQAKFLVPVFRTKESSPDFQLDEALLEPYVQARSTDDLLRDAEVRRDPLPGQGQRFVFGAVRSVGAAFGWTFVLCIWSSFIGIMIWLGAPIIFPIVFGLFDLALIWASLDLWLSHTVVEVQHDEVRVRNGWLGLGKLRRVARDQVESIMPTKNMQSGTSAWYHLKMATADGYTLTIGKYIAGRRLAQSVADAVLEAIRGEPGE